MKTTLDLPDHLITEVKIRAAKEKRKMKDVIAEALEKGLRQEKATTSKKSTQSQLEPLFNAPFPDSLDGANFNRLAEKWDDYRTLDELSS